MTARKKLTSTTRSIGRQPMLTNQSDTTGPGINAQRDVSNRSSLVWRGVVLVLELDEVARHLVAHAHDAHVDEVLERAELARRHVDVVVDGREVVEDEELLDVGDELQQRLARSRLEHGHNPQYVHALSTLRSLV